MKILCSIAAASAALVILSTTLSFGQASQSEMQGFPIPPPSGFVATKAFAYVGDYGYYTSPTASLPGQSANAADYKYVRYSGVDGKRVWVYGAWGSTLIPAPPRAVMHASTRTRATVFGGNPKYRSLAASFGLGGTF